MPIVLIDYDSLCKGENRRYDLVSFDNVSSGLALGRSLLARGCRNIAFLLKTGSPPSVVDRMRGVSAAVVESGGSWSWRDNVLACDTADSRYICAFVRRRRPDAIVCGNDLIAVRLRALLVSAKCLDRMSLAGFDNQSEAERLGIVSVSHPCDKLAHVALRTLLSRLRNPTDTVHTVLVPGSVVVR